MKVTRKYQYYDVFDHTWYWLEIQFNDSNFFKPTKITLNCNNFNNVYSHSTMIFNTSRDRVFMSKCKWNTYLNLSLTILEMFGFNIKILDMSYLAYQQKSLLRRIKELFEFETIRNLLDIRKLIHEDS